MRVPGLVTAKKSESPRKYSEHPSINVVEKDHENSKCDFVGFHVGWVGVRGRFPTTYTAYETYINS
jgi:hypothetical protein